METSAGAMVTAHLLPGTVAVWRPSVFFVGESVKCGWTRPGRLKPSRQTPLAASRQLTSQGRQFCGWSQPAFMPMCSLGYAGDLSLGLRDGHPLTASIRSAGRTAVTKLHGEHIDVDVADVGRHA